MCYPIQYRKGPFILNFWLWGINCAENSCSSLLFSSLLLHSPPPLPFLSRPDVVDLLRILQGGMFWPLRGSRTRTRLTPLAGWLACCSGAVPWRFDNRHSRVLDPPGSGSLMGSLAIILYPSIASGTFASIGAYASFYVRPLKVLNRLPSIFVLYE
jgi:hypothetical protein